MEVFAKEIHISGGVKMAEKPETVMEGMSVKRKQSKEKKKQFNMSNR